MGALAHEKCDHRSGDSRSNAQNHGQGRQIAELGKQPGVVEDRKGRGRDQAKDGAVSVNGVAFKEEGDQLGDEKIPSSTPMPKGVSRRTPWSTPGMSRTFRASRKFLMVSMMP